MKESGELHILETTENPVRPASPETIETKHEDRGTIRKEITNLKEEIERIKIADSKVEDAKLRAIPLEAVADDISAAGQSIEERQAKIRLLKDTLHNSSNKHWWQKAAVVLGFTLGGLLAAKEASGQKKSEVKSKANIEIVKKNTKETAKEDFSKYLEYLQEKNKTDSITPEDMDTYLKKWENTGGFQSSDAIQGKNIQTLHDIYQKHSPYALDGKKIPIENLIPGYDMEFGYDKDDRILINKILTGVGFDFSKVEDISKEDFGQGEVVTNFRFEDKVTIGDKTIDMSISYMTGFRLFTTSIYDKDGKQIANFVCGARDVATKKIDHSVFEAELTKIFEEKN